MVCLKTYQSSRIEWLANRLGENLYDRADPFDLPTVVVPNQSIKEMLSHLWAKEMGITMGIRFQFLEEATLQQAGIKEPFPNRVEVALKVGQILEKDPYSPISEYLKKNKARIVSLSNALAEPLMQWAIYGGQLPEWVEALAKRVYQDWGVPREKLKGRSLKKPLHLFGFSHLPPIYFNFFATGPTSFYLFSPCAHFWTDVLTEKGASALEVDQEVNPLLADWGGLTRRLLKQLEEAEAETIEHYPLSGGVASHKAYEDYLGGELLFEKEKELTTLKRVQADLLLLRDGAQDKGIDETLLVHATPSRLREVEVCAEAVLKSMERGSAPSDWVVMAPDITPYVPYIEAVFEREGLPYRIQGIVGPLEGSLEGGLIQLLALIGSRWEASHLLKWMSHPLVMEQANLSKEDLIQFEKWIGSGGIRWGKNGAHWAEIFSIHYEGEGKGEGSASWETGFCRLFEALARGKLDMELSQAETLGKLCTLYEALKKRVFEIEKGYISLAEWAALLSEISGEFFGKACPFPWRGFEGESFSFDHLRPHLEREWGAVSSTRSAHHLEGVCFRSLLPMQGRFSSHLFLLGMDEEAFPRKKKRQSFELIHPALPSPGSLDRALFLEIFHGVSKTLEISYTHTSLDDGTPVYPSPLVQDLMSYLGTEPLLHPHAGYLESETYSESQCQRASAPFVPFEFSILPQPSLELTIDVSELRLSASDPFRLYSRQLGVDQSRRVSEVEDVEAFDWDPIEMALRVWSHAGHKGSLPSASLPAGPFGPMIAEKVAREGSRLQKELEEVTRKKLEMLTLGGEIPPLEVPLKGGGFARIIGEVGPYVPEGLIIFSKGVRAWVRNYPLFLVFATLIEREGLNIDPTLHLIRDKVSYPAPKDPSSFLKNYLTYYLRCLREPAPFDGEGILDLLKGKMEGWDEVKLAFAPILKGEKE